MCLWCIYPHNEIPIKMSLNLPITEVSAYSHQLGTNASCSLMLWISLASICFSLPPFHVYAAAVMIINRNIKASGAILVCDNPHTLVSTTLTCRCHGNAVYVIMSPHSADIESHCMSSPAYSGNVTCWLLYQPFSSYIRKESPAERDTGKAFRNPHPHTYTQTHTLQQFNG